MASIGHPLLGDELYGAKDLSYKRFMLHSHELDFIHPITCERINIIKKLPFDMEKLVKESD
jgi:23S rRNA pseudouridine1911/1915/1917 synthase